LLLLLPEVREFKRHKASNNQFREPYLIYLIYLIYLSTKYLNKVVVTVSQNGALARAQAEQQRW
jgi:hypothetical protein